MVTKKGFNFCEKEIDCLFELIDEMLHISRKEWEELAMQHHSFFSAQECNAELLKLKFIAIAKKDPQSAHPVVWNMSGMLWSS